MPYCHIALYTLLAMLAFAGNSLLCRLALASASIDPAAFTLIRLFSGAAVLWLIFLARTGSSKLAGSWGGAVALVIYAVSFSYGYVSSPAAMGALLLFAAVQATMIGFGLWRGERLARWQSCGFAIALVGLLILLLPGLSAPPLWGSLLMLLAGVAWGSYSLAGRRQGDPLAATTGNFIRSLVLIIPLLLFAYADFKLTSAGVVYAIASGAVASGLGYAIWYSAIKGLTATSASVVQLSVPLITALGGVLFLGEVISLRLMLVTIAILGGIALVMLGQVRT